MRNDFGMGKLSLKYRGLLQPAGPVMVAKGVILFLGEEYSLTDQDSVTAWTLL